MSFSSTVTFAVALILEYIVIFDLIIVFNSVPLVPIFLSTILLLFSYSACSLSIRYIYIYIYSCNHEINHEVVLTVICCVKECS